MNNQDEQIQTVSLLYHGYEMHRKVKTIKKIIIGWTLSVVILGGMLIYTIVC